MTPVIRQAFRACDEDEASDDALLREIDKPENENLREAIFRLVFVDAYGMMPEVGDGTKFIENGSAPTPEIDFIDETNDGRGANSVDYYNNASNRLLAKMNTRLTKSSMN